MKCKVTMKRLVFAALLVLLCAPAKADPAASADRFVDSIGINTHLSHVGSAYWNYLTTSAPNGQTTVSTLKNLGVRHIRDSIVTTTDFGPVLCPIMLAIGANGQDFDLYTNYQYPGNTVRTTNQADLAQAGLCLNQNPAYLLSFEGPNELDGGNAGFPCPDIYCTQEMLQQAAMTNAARTAGLFPPSVYVFAAGSSNGHCEANIDWGQANGGVYRTNIDFPNNHGYFGNFEPDIPSTGGDVCGLPPPPAFPLYGGWPYFVKTAGLMAPDLGFPYSSYPVATTETGYTDILMPTSGVDQTTKSKYEMRNVLGYFANGSYYTFIYDLANDITSTFGLTDENLNVKPAYISIQNLILALSDPGPGFSPSDLAYTATLPDDVSSLLLGKRDGSYWLVLWQKDRSYDVTALQPISVPPTQGTLTFSVVPNAMAQYVFDPSTGAVTTNVIAPAASVTVPITDTPSIVQIGASNPITFAADAPPLPPPPPPIPAQK
jgi:hypothetical protein